MVFLPLNICVCVCMCYEKLFKICVSLFFFSSSFAFVASIFRNLCQNVSQPIEHTFIISISCKMYILFVILFLRGSGAVILSEIKVRFFLVLLL